MNTNITIKKTITAISQTPLIGENEDGLFSFFLSLLSPIDTKVQTILIKGMVSIKGMVGLLFNFKKLGKKYGSLYGTTEKTPPPPMENHFYRVIYRKHLYPTIFVIPTTESFQGSSHGRNRGI